MNILNQLFFSFSPIRKFIVQGNSMLPAFKNGESILALRLPSLLLHYRKNDAVVVRISGKKKYIIKRIAKVKDDRYWIVGDNARESTDSRAFGWVNKKDILGKVLYKMAHA